MLMRRKKLSVARAVTWHETGESRKKGTQITEARDIEKHVQPQQKTPSLRTDTDVRENKNKKKNFSLEARESVPKRTEATQKGTTARTNKGG